MKLISKIGLGITLMIFSLVAGPAFVAIAYAKDVKISRADNDQIVSCQVGDVLVVSFLRGAKVYLESGSGLCVSGGRPGDAVRGKYRVEVEKAGKTDLKLQRCFGDHCVKLLVHIDASEAKKEKPKK